MARMWRSAVPLGESTGPRSGNANPVGAAEFSQSFKQVLWGSLSAAGVLITLPVIVFALLTQRHLVKGLTAGAVKE
jgi:multiple sugar transport system permease protein